MTKFDLIKMEALSEVNKDFYQIRTSSSNRSTRPEVSRKKGFLKNFAKFTGKDQREALFFNIVSGLRPATLSKERPWHRCFSVNHMAQ